MNINVFRLGYESNVAPKFIDFSYAQWASRFKLFVESRNIDLWKIIDCAYIVPTLEKSKWSNHDNKMFNMNKLLLEYLLNAFDSSFSNKFVHFDSAYKLWKFIEAHQGDLEAIQQALKDSSSSSCGASCTRPQEDNSCVVSDSDFDNDLSIDELACAYERLSHAYTKLQNNFIDLKSKHVDLKSDHESLASKLDIVVKENAILKENNELLSLENNNMSSSIASLTHANNDAMIEVETIRNEFSSFKKDHVSSTSISNACMHNDKLNHVKNHISCFDSALNTCIDNHKKLMNKCAKSSAITYKSPTHYAHLYSKVYKCSICGRKGHLAKFCYDAHKYKNVNAPCASHQVSSSHVHTHAPIVHHKHANVYHCDFCGRVGHLAKFCFDLRKVSKSQNISSRPTLFQNVSHL